MDSVTRGSGSRLVPAILLVVVAMQWATPALAARCYVDGAATAGLNTGQSWQDAYTDLQSALADTTCDEAWVAKGVYKPVVPQDMANVTIDERIYSFHVQKGVYGGFSGNETSLDQRIPTPHLTVLSGDIDDNDVNTGSNRVTQSADDIVGSNSYNVVTLRGGRLDAMTVTGGKSDAFDGYNGTRGNGGGIYCRGGGATITNVTIMGNTGMYAGGMYNYLSSPTLHNVSFNRNSSSSGPGGMFNSAWIPNGGGSSSPKLSNVTFYGNSGSIAGAMVNDGSGGTSFTTLLNVTFAENSASRAGNGAGAIYNSKDGTSNPTATVLTVSNVLFWGNTNTADGVPSAIVNAYGAVSDIHSSVYIDSIPVGPLGNYGGWTPTVLLRPNSPAIGAGDPVVCIGPPVNGLDQRGVWRFYDESTHCDVGAVEMDLDSRDWIFADGFE